MILSCSWLQTLAHGPMESPLPIKGESEQMKAFLSAILALIVITVGADVVLDQIGFSAEDYFQKDSVRLGD